METNQPNENPFLCRLRIFFSYSRLVPWEKPFSSRCLSLSFFRESVGVVSE